MVNELLVNLIDRILGVGDNKARHNRAYRCPNPECSSHLKKKLEINFDSSSPNYEKFGCWTCGFRGNKLKNVFKFNKLTSQQKQELKKYVEVDNRNEKIVQDEIEVELPKEFKSLIGANSRKSKFALNYLKDRNVTINDIMKYNIGYCEWGEYSDMIILPSYDNNGELNYFTGRSFQKDSWIKYKNPPTSRNIIPDEHLINWELPIILCEGKFDQIAIKRNVIPLLGKNIQSKLMEKLVISSVKKIYIALDKDALHQALNHCETLLNNGKKVYLVEMDDKDPSEMGFVNFTKLIQNVPSLTFNKLFEKKLMLI